PLQHDRRVRRFGGRRARGEESVRGLAMDDMYRDYILDHYKNPRNSGPLEGATHTYHDSNPLCGDELTMQLRISDGHVDDVRVIGERSATVNAGADWLLRRRLNALLHLLARDMPTWCTDLSPLDFQDIYHFFRASDKHVQNWGDVPGYLKDTFTKLGIPQAD